MSGTTSDPTDPRLSRGTDTEPRPQAEVYLVLSDEERSRGFIRPVRKTYIHNLCGAATSMGQALAETYAAQPTFYGATYCVKCGLHAGVAEFKWEDGSVVGS